MPLKVHNGSSFVNATPKVYNGTSFQTIKQGVVWNGSAWKQFFSIITGTPSSSTLSGDCETYEGGSCSATSTSVTITPGGGVGPYTYSWERVSGDTLTINSPTSATTTFSHSGIVPSEVDAVYRCKVTDSTGLYGYSSGVSISLDHLDDGSPPP